MAAMRRFLLLVALLVLGVVFALDQELVDAQTGDCAAALPGFPDSSTITFYRPWTSDVIRRDTLPYVFTFKYSPDCRFVVGHSLGYGDCSPGLIIWDAATGERRKEFRGMCDVVAYSYPRLFWRPDNTAVIISSWYRGRNMQSSTPAQIIWYPSTDQIVELEFIYDNVHANMFQVYWDDTRGWVWSSGRDGILAFDTVSGRQMVSFQNLSSLSLRHYRYGTVSYFALSPDASKVIAYGQQDAFGWTEPALSVFDIPSGARTELNSELNAAGSVALSPDNRYLIMTYTAIRVWDLWSLPEAVEARLPIYRLPLPGDNSEVYFVDSTALAARSGDVVYEWDLASGQRIR